MRYFMIVALFVASFAGCGGDTGPKLYPVTGKITINGAPADQIQVTFQPVGGEGAEAGGNCTNGTYTMYSGAKGDQGVQAGKYKVILTEAAGDDYMKSSTSADPTKAKKDGKIPASYSDSPKEVEVPAPDNTIDIEI